MTPLETALDTLLDTGFSRLVVSNPQGGSALRRICVTKLGSEKDTGTFLVEEFSVTQAFQRHMDTSQIHSYVAGLLTSGFRQVNTEAYQLRVSKRGKVFLTSTPQGARTGTPDTVPAEPSSSSEPVSNDYAASDVQNNPNPKHRLIPAGQNVPPLVDMGVLTKDGKVVSSMYDKYRQINRFVELLDDGLRDFPQDHIRVIDFGCGKSYLTFVVYHYLTEVRGLSVDMVGLDLKADVIAQCNTAAQRYGYEGLHFQLGDIDGYDSEFAPDLVISLHACDTATDLALANAVNWGTGLIYSVPCCQHELNAQMRAQTLGALTRYGIVQERVAALCTDAMRADLLEACGYKTQLLEFVDLSHTPKKLLIRARKVQRPPQAACATRQAMLEEVEALCHEFDFQPMLLRLLRENGAL